ncbi:MAG: GNAT family N-acetyltransferase [Muribaculaceae bacterium]|nr:GNAT family N-acetyltransferase [Muribaculaceae bacterium]
MSTLAIERYTAEMQAEWDAFVKASRNGTMLHLRPYMDYHSDRFRDHSLVVRGADGHILAALPACEDGTTLWSHRGLTYGGWLTATRHVTAATMLQIFEMLVEYMRRAGFERLVYSPVPHIYHRYPADDDLYALWRMGAELVRVMPSSSIDLRRPRLMDHGTKNAINRARRSGAVFAEYADFAAFWPLLEQVLREHHDAAPVHTLAEIELLRSRFPEDIRLFTAMLDGRVEAGVVMYRCGPVMHAQYTAAGPVARSMRLLPALYAYIADAHCAGCDWLDIGTSCEDGGRVLNEGLDAQKAGLGGRSTAYTTYSLRILTPLLNKSI